MAFVAGIFKAHSSFSKLGRVYGMDGGKEKIRGPMSGHGRYFLQDYDRQRPSQFCRNPALAVNLCMTKHIILFPGENNSYQNQNNVQSQNAVDRRRQEHKNLRCPSSPKRREDSLTKLCFIIQTAGQNRNIKFDSPAHSGGLSKLSRECPGVFIAIRTKDKAVFSCKRGGNSKYMCERIGDAKIF